MNAKKIVLCAFVVLTSTMVFSQDEEIKEQQLDEIVVTGSRFEIKKEDSGKVITKITQEELKRMPGKSVAEIINATVGIEINGTKSNAGQNLSYFVRGGRNRQVVILIDGIALTDASQIANDYDLRLLHADQVESIEVLKGASSTLYGSGAGTAVINIKLKESSKEKFKANFRSVFGSNQTSDDNGYGLEFFQNSVSFNGSLEKLNYLMSFGNTYSDGFSAIASGTEKDAYNAINTNLKLGYRFSDNFNLTLYGGHDKFKADFDDSFSFSDANNLLISEQQRVGLSSKFKYTNGSLNVNATYNDVERETESSSPSIFASNNYGFDVFNKYNFNNKFYTVLGVNYKKSEMESYSVPFGETELSKSIDSETASFEIIDPYLNLVYVSDFGLSINSGLRLNNHSEYGSHLVYSINPSYKEDTSFGYLKGLASYSTAYITPSLFQLFEPTFGNPDLEPEENETLEFGVEFGFSKKATISAVYFNRKETNFIDFVDLGNFVFQYNNIDESFTTSGLELVVDYKVSSKLRAQLNGTYTKVDKDLDLRIPEIKVNAKLDYNFNDNTFASLSYQFNDARNDAFYNTATFKTEAVVLDSYSLLDVYFSHTILKNKMTLFTNITNILNAEFQELYGFATKGRNFNVGFNLSL
jgi:vitamin B12 transporter